MKQLNLILSLRTSKQTVWLISIILIMILSLVSPLVSASGQITTYLEETNSADIDSQVLFDLVSEAIPETLTAQTIASLLDVFKNSTSVGAQLADLKFEDINRISPLLLQEVFTEISTEELLKMGGERVISALDIMHTNQEFNQIPPQKLFNLVIGLPIDALSYLNSETFETLFDTLATSTVSGATFADLSTSFQNGLILALNDDAFLQRSADIHRLHSGIAIQRLASINIYNLSIEQFDLIPVSLLTDTINLSTPIMIFDLLQNFSAEHRASIFDTVADRFEFHQIDPQKLFDFVNIAGSELLATLSSSTLQSFLDVLTSSNASGIHLDDLPSDIQAVLSRTMPDAPTGLSANAGNGQVSLSWTAPSNDGGSAITGYTVTGTPGGTCTTATGTTSCTITGLTNGTAYTFTVVTTNAAGNSQASNTANATPVVPSSPPPPPPPPPVDPDPVVPVEPEPTPDPDPLYDDGTTQCGIAGCEVTQNEDGSTTVTHSTTDTTTGTQTNISTTHTDDGETSITHTLVVKDSDGNEQVRTSASSALPGSTTTLSRDAQGQPVVVTRAQDSDGTRYEVSAHSDGSAVHKVTRPDGQVTEVKSTLPGAQTRITRDPITQEVVVQTTQELPQTDSSDNRVRVVINTQADGDGTTYFERFDAVTQSWEVISSTLNPISHFEPGHQVSIEFNAEGSLQIRIQTNVAQVLYF